MPKAMRETGKREEKVLKTESEKMRRVLIFKVIYLIGYLKNKFINHLCTYYFNRTLFCREEERITFCFFSVIFGFFKVYTYLVKNHGYASLRENYIIIVCSASLRKSYFFT